MQTTTTCWLHHLSLLAALGVGIHGFAAPPANDHFANRTALTGTQFVVNGSTIDASRETNEPVHAGMTGGKSAWWTWTAPATATYQFALTNHAPIYPWDLVYVPIFAMYTGSDLATLTPVVSGGFDNPTLLTLEATAGTTYQIAVDGGMFFGFYPPSSADFQIHLGNPPANDNFANATDLGNATSGNSASILNAFTTGEPGEPEAPNPWNAPRTIWWKWTAPATSLVNVDTLTGAANTVLQVYTGTDVTMLTLLRESHDADALGRSRLTLQAVGGTTYYFRVRGETLNDYGAVTLSFSTLPTVPITLSDHMQRGRASLEMQDSASLADADASFQAALALDANHPEANFFKAMSGFAMLEQGTAFATALSGIGIVDSDLYSGGYTMPKDAFGNRVVAQGTNSVHGINYLINTVKPALSTIRAHLDKAASSSFVTSLSDSESVVKYATIDAGDVHLLRATTHMIDALICLMQTFDAAVSVADAVDAYNTQTLNAEKLFDDTIHLLEGTGTNGRTAFKNAIQAANTAYQAGSAFIRLNRVNPADESFLFSLPTNYTAQEQEARTHAQSVSASFNGVTTVAGKAVDFSKFVSSNKSLRQQAPGLSGDRAVAGTFPDPTFDGVLPNGTQAEAADRLRKYGLLHEVTTFGNWATYYLKNQPPANQTPSADADGDFLSNFAEFAFNLNPVQNSAPGEYMVSSLQTHALDGQQYLHITFNRRIVSSGIISYVVAVSDNLSTWDRTGTQIELVGSPVPTGDGITESVTFRVLAVPGVTAKKFVRLEVSDLQP
ncbi:MAG: hypothetical protein IPK32_23120 [Verrucomicrobiaceae bacterium]|nr:hypothetical protein [Verrucomicrobiaceae bacterium]